MAPKFPLEYYNELLHDILQKRRIMHKRSTPYSPEQNERAERDMRIAIEAARSMIHYENLSVKFWDYFQPESRKYNFRFAHLLRIPVVLSLLTTKTLTALKTLFRERLWIMDEESIIKKET
uniref:Integrase catalytic domain-containing protein n=1 Tax=Glossina austeni TaxID=7395 RepID=A0A1A9V5Q7_GLOAU